MTEQSFFDTNILIYRDDRGNPAKQAVAKALINRGFNSGRLVISTQVLQEYFVSATKKLKIDVVTARRKVEIYGSQPTVRPDSELILQAIDLHRLHQLALWDALIVCSAQISNCKVLYTEDLHNGQKFDGVTVVNPFA